MAVKHNLPCESDALGVRIHNADDLKCRAYTRPTPTPKINSSGRAAAYARGLALRVRTRSIEGSEFSTRGSKYKFAHPKAQNKAFREPVRQEKYTTGSDIQRSAILRTRSAAAHASVFPLCRDAAKTSEARQVYP
ncbi:MAG: hypothetical protein IPK82_20255 [Polyangiaceae bacterium]|nr:hypothetical protein [Polyangiaceae bacterium]